MTIIASTSTSTSTSSPTSSSTTIKTTIAKGTAFHISLPGGREIDYNAQTGVLRIKLEPSSTTTNLKIPPMDTPPKRETLDAIEIQYISEQKGYGAFAKKNLASDTFLGFYEGTKFDSREALDKAIRQRQRQRQIRKILFVHDGSHEVSDSDNDKKSNEKKSQKELPSYRMDYVMSLDGGQTFLDGFDRAQDRNCFSTVHLNHADKGSEQCNVIRLMKEDRIAFFTSRDIIAGEELQFDYGSNFWRGREHLKVVC
eukprot:CAMPEP_0184860914 /NCGR_PEP_ID=MMETSP0580-20130426/5708_1 /TAXON_ID=1118495 /ORGANISM="Dactyliosolen fragilissimus" /LENGTH=254 /DNA_ID=CAMNT_0027358189 /DNA_START=3 /DNA_END=767 /DNA_ORIENTATION=-